MIPLIELLYNQAMDEWHETCRFLSGEEDRAYSAHARRSDAYETKVRESASEETLRLFEFYLKSQEEVGALDRRVCFARGLSMGLRLGQLGVGE